MVAEKHPHGSKKPATRWRASNWLSPSKHNESENASSRVKGDDDNTCFLQKAKAPVRFRVKNSFPP